MYKVAVSIAAAALALLPTTLAAPVAQGFPPPSYGTQYFTLKAVVPGAYANPDCHSDFNNSYAILYHTGAGLNDVTFTPNSNATETFINATSAQLMADVAYYEGPADYEPYAFITDVDGSIAEYESFSKVTCNGGYGDIDNMGAYYITADGLQYNSEGTSADPQANISENEFGGWLVCDWYHDAVPQLFAINKDEGSTYPKNCECVNLEPCYTN